MHEIYKDYYGMSIKPKEEFTMKKVFGFIAFAIAIWFGICAVAYLAYTLIPMWKMYLYGYLPTTSARMALTTAAYVIGGAAPAMLMYLGGKKLWNA